MQISFKNVKDLFQKTDWQLLLFLIAVLNVKMFVKIPALILLLILNRRIFRDKNIIRQKFIWFYFSVILIAIINAILHLSDFDLNKSIVTGIGIAFWVLCIACACLSSWFVNKLSTEKLHHTISFFFILNMLFTIFQLLYIVYDSGSVNPYTYQGEFQKYFISTGDRMTGITMDVSTTNALINAFGLFYFLYRNRFLLCLAGMVTLLLTGSNITNILMVLLFLICLVFRSSKAQKSIMVGCIVLLVIFLARISPQNNRYIVEAWEKINGRKKSAINRQNNFNLLDAPDSTLSFEQLREKKARKFIDSVAAEKISNKADSGSALITALPPVIKPEIPKPNIHSAPFQRKRDTTSVQRELLTYAKNHISGFSPGQNGSTPGKIASFKQTISYLRTHSAKILLGTGTGNFSSKLAFRATALHIAGGYPARFAYANEPFLNNHLRLYLDYFSKDLELHSIINTPNSVYDQLLAEYGIIGLISFFIFYIGFFARKYRKMSFGFPLLIILLAVMGIEYWFEQLSIVVLFELMMLLQLKETETKNE